MSLEHRAAEIEKSRERLRARADKLGARIEDLRDERADVTKRAQSKTERLKELEAKIAKKDRAELWTKRACIDGATTWKGLVLVLTVVEARTAWNGGVNAADRTVAHHDDCGNKSSQQELYDGWIAGLPGFYPANPPGTGSHEGIADATLSRIFNCRAGSKLPEWAWGLDLSDGPGFERGAEQLGFKVVRPYPNEAWHCQLTENPTPTLERLGVI